MKLLANKSLFSTLLFTCLFGVAFSFSAVAAEDEQAKNSLERLSKSLRELNFNTSFVVVKNNQAEPYHWLHGIVEKSISENEVANGELNEAKKKGNNELEIFALLNGPRRDIFRVNNRVTYI